jgi:hypothetical protein
MRLVMTLLVSDEEGELIEAVLKYHLEQGVAFFVVTAHRAPERTLEILDRYSKTGKLHLDQELGAELRQSELVTAMARRAATEFEADWVINADADEFFWPERGTLTDVFAAVPQQFHTLTMPEYDFVPRRDETGFFADRLVVRPTVSIKHGGWFGAGVSDAQAEAKLGVRLSETGIPRGAGVSSKMAHRARADIVVGVGNHRVHGDGLVAVPDGWWPAIVFHFPLRRFRQYEAKIIQGGIATQGSRGWFLRQQLYSLHQQGGLQSYYEDKVIDQAQLERGIREGRLVIDDRLKRFLRDLSNRDSGGGGESVIEKWNSGQFCDTGGHLAWPEESLEVAELRAEMERALYRREFDPLTRRAVKLERRLVRVGERRRKFRQTAKRAIAEARRERQTAKRAIAEARRETARAAAMERTAWWRLGAGMHLVDRGRGSGKQLGVRRRRAR